MKNWKGWMLAAAVVLSVPAAGWAASTAKGDHSRGTGPRAEQLARTCTALKRLGFYKGEVVQKWSPELHQSVAEFQKSRGLKSTGRLNKETRLALGLEETPGKAAKEGEGAGKISP